MAEAAAQEAFQINIVGQYTKDLSFEAPETPGIFQALQQKQPDVDINIGVNVNSGPETMSEVILHIDAKCTLDGRTVFIVDLDYAGLVQIDAPEEQMHPVLMIEIPRFLFPFARNILAETSRNAGFMPLMLGPVDFAAMYQNMGQGGNGGTNGGAPASDDA